MKTLAKNLKNLVIGMLVGLPVISFASGDISVVAEDKSTDMDKIKVEVPELYDLDVSIVDEEGRSIYFETLKKGSKSALLYNLSNLDDGMYTFTSQAGHQTVVKDINVENNKIDVIEKVVENKPVFMVEDDVVKINYLNKDLDKIKVSLESNSSIYYDKKMDAELSFSKMINISSLQRGSYYVSMEAGDDQYTFYFDVN